MQNGIYSNGDASAVITITPDNPKPDGILIPGTDKTYSGVSEKDLNKTVTRTIIIHTPHSGDKTVKQTAKVTRSATVNTETGEVSYSEWSKAEWPEYDASLEGYTATQKDTPSYDIDHSELDQTVKKAQQTLGLTVNKDQDQSSQTGEADADTAKQQTKELITST